MIGALAAVTATALLGGLVTAVNRRLWRSTAPCDHPVGSAVAADARHQNHVPDR